MGSLTGMGRGGSVALLGGCRDLGGLRWNRADAEALHQLGDGDLVRLLLVLLVQVAAAARADEALGVAHGDARVEVVDARLDLVLELLEAALLLARLLELAGVDLAHPLGGTRGALDALPLAHEGADVGETEAHLLQPPDPPDTHERFVGVEAIAALGPRRGREQAELLVEVDGAHRAARFLCKVTNLHQVAALARFDELPLAGLVGRLSLIEAAAAA